MSMTLQFSGVGLNIAVANNEAELNGLPVADIDDVTFPVLVLEDLGNCFAMVIQGTHEELAAFGQRITDQASLAGRTRYRCSVCGTADDEHRFSACEDGEWERIKD